MGPYINKKDTISFGGKLHKRLEVYILLKLGHEKKIYKGPWTPLV